MYLYKINDKPTLTVEVSTTAIQALSAFQTMKARELDASKYVDLKAEEEVGRPHIFFFSIFNSFLLVKGLVQL